MIRTNNFGWKLTHVLCIMAHLGLVVAAGVVYIYNMAKQSERMTEKCSNIDLTSTDSLPCSLALVSGYGNFGSIDLLLHTLLVSCLSVGIMGLVISMASFATLMAVEPTKVALTEGEQHWRKQVVTLFSCIFNIILAGAGLGLAAALGLRVSNSRSLITPLVFAAIQAPMCIATALYDAIKNRRDGRDLLD
ncbi:hypothetical protein QBC37DRAFT_138784 [Rhypophila decipiens]|uniref:Uncharacterized protein n=1 Tax=Rhypophila decipiens TaxID=261697 RepID=A0AAN6YBS2_9PEZI|nr:hypothetical protein QBC37DRAFT_138784 [Rhypophila decipiens]